MIFSLVTTEDAEDAEDSVLRGGISPANS